MKEQRLATKPFVIPDTSIGHYDQGYNEDLRGLAEGRIPISITNVGAETAIELKLTLKTPKSESYEPIEELPLLTQNVHYKTITTLDWRNADINNPKPVPEGYYEIKVSFRSTTYKPCSAPSEVILPFELKKDQHNIWTVKRDALIKRLTEA